VNARHLLAPLAAAAALAVAPVDSQAGLVIQIWDGTAAHSALTIADGSALDQDTADGSVAFGGSYWGWNFLITMGSSAADPLAMHLTSSVLGDRTDGQIWISFTQTGLDAGAGPVGLSADGGGSGSNGSILADWAAYVDDSNAAFGTATQVAGGSGFASGGGWATVPLTDSYSATLVTHFDYRNILSSGAYGSSLDVSMYVPEPTSLALLGIGLLGMGVSRRRSKAVA